MNGTGNLDNLFIYVTNMASQMMFRGRFMKAKKVSGVLARENALSSHKRCRNQLVDTFPSQIIQEEHTYCAQGPQHTYIMPVTTRDDVNTKTDWKTGRRIVNLHHLAVTLQCGCSSCEMELRLIDTVSELRQGAGSFLKVKCRYCQSITTVSTDTRHCSKEDGPQNIMDINTKLALGVIHAGLGPTNLNKLFAALNIPSVHHTTLKAREIEAGQAIEKLAKSSCQTVISKELLSSSGRNEPKPDDHGSNSVTASFDGAWQKRGSGRSYNSLSGHASLFGKETGKILAYDVRCKQCRTCQVAEKNGRPPKHHNCRKNWTGSAKAMESNMCVSMLSGLKQKGIKVGTLVMDNDSTSIAKVRTEVDGTVKKASDSNHLKKSFTSKLYSISKKYRQLSGSVIAHIGKCFMYAIKQNSGDTDEMKTNLCAIVPHLYGDHKLCNNSWCGYMKSPTSYVPRSLPYRKYLSDKDLKGEMVRILDEYANNCDNLSDLGSSQRNESFNNVVAARNPKNKHYSASESTCFRVASAVAETNMASSYISEVNKQLFLSPGGNTTISCKTNDKKRKAKSDLQQTTIFKRQRRQYKENQKKEYQAKELREGSTYKSDVGLFETNLEDIEHIPQPVHEPILEHVKPGVYEEIVFDVETTGLGLSAIVQLSAASTTGITFNRYVCPTESMTTEASRITGLSLHDGKVYKNGVELKSITLKQCIQDFIEWLQTFDNSVILIAHNSNFDASILINSCQQVQVSNISNCVVGFLDTLVFFRNTYHNMKNYKLGTLLETILNLSFKAHDAVEDCKYLCLLYKHTKTVHNLKLTEILKYSTTTEYTIKKLQHSQMTSRNVQSFREMINKSYLTNFMAKKIASSGLSLCSLKLAFDRDSENGLKSLLSEKTNGKFRVTNCTKVIKKCNAYFQDKI